jgi:hypothetical protein
MPAFPLIGKTMRSPMLSIAVLYGAAIGALATATIGFTVGGWVTQSTALLMAEASSQMAVASVLTPYCLERSRSDPLSTQVLSELETSRGFNRRGVIERAGWATPLGSDKPLSEVAIACETALAKG